MSSKILKGVIDRFPPLDVFDEKISNLYDVREKIS
jgi:hypothetical protein